MALQGTIDSFPLVDVLQLLATSSKTGRLELSGDRGRGILWIRSGRPVAGSIDEHPSPDAASAVWELLRFDEGSFEFTAGEQAEEIFDGDMSDAISQASAMLEDWERITRSVESLRHRVHLCCDGTGEDVQLSADEWAVVVAAAGSAPSVGEIVETLHLGEFTTGQRLAALLERGLLVLDAPAAAETPQDDAQPVVPEAQPSSPDAQAEAAVTFLPLDVEEEDHGGAWMEAAAEQDGFVAAPTPAEDHFPDHFPIDDLVGDDVTAPHWQTDSHTADTVTAHPDAFERTTPGSDPAFAPSATEVVSDDAWVRSGDVGQFDPPAGSDPVALFEGAAFETAAGGTSDDVLAQIGRLSPKAAEAIAAALGDGHDTGA